MKFGYVVLFKNIETCSQTIVDVIFKNYRDAFDSLQNESKGEWEQFDYKEDKNVKWFQDSAKEKEAVIIKVRVQNGKG